MNAFEFPLEDSRDVDSILDEILQKQRRGESVSLQDCYQQYPEHEQVLRSILPAFLTVENLKHDSVASSNSGATASSTLEIDGFIGDYQLVREVGRGGMGVVYEAEQKSLGRRVALKVLKRERDNELAAQRFENEARAAARMHHTNIVPVFDVGSDQDHLFYAMQLIEGESLDLVIRDLRRLRSADLGDGMIDPQAMSLVNPNVEDLTKVDDDLTKVGRRKSFRQRARQKAMADREQQDVHVDDLETSKTNKASSCSGALAMGPVVRSPGFRREMRGLPPKGGTTNSLDTDSLDTDSLDTNGQDSKRPERSAGANAASSSNAAQATDSPTSRSFVNLSQSTDPSAVFQRREFYRGVARLGFQAADALAYAHARSIVHRDIKPSNLLLDKNGILWITDFGLAKSDELDVTVTGDILGTIRYMSPERFDGHCDIRADIYGLGLTLYEMLGLGPAFAASDQGSLIGKIKSSVPRSLREIDPHVPKDLETIVFKSIEKEPRSRYSSAQQLAEDLDRFIKDQPILARRASLWERFTRWSRHNRPLANAMGAIGTILFLVTLASVFVAFRLGQLEDIANDAAATARREQVNSAKLETRANQKAQEAQEANYYNQIALAEYEWDRTNVARARALLEACPVEFRNWEWQYLNTVTQGVDAITIGGTPRVNGLATDYSGLCQSPDGKYLLASRRGEACVYDLKTLELIHRLEGHVGDVTCIAFSQDGSRIVTAAANSVTLWDAATYRQLHVINIDVEIRYGIYSLGVNEDGSRVSALIDPENKLFCWDIQADRIERRELPGIPRVVGVHDMSADGNRLLMCSGLEWIVYDIERQEIVTKSQFPHGVLTVAVYSPDETKVATGARERNHYTIKLWDAETGTLEETLIGHEDDITSLDFHPDGRSIASCSRDRTVRVWRLKSTAPELVLRGHQAGVTDLQFSRRGEAIFSMDVMSRAKIWKTPKPYAPAGIRHVDVINGLEFHPNKPWLYSVGQGGHILVRDFVTGEIIQDYQGVGPITAMALSPDGNRIAVSIYGETQKVFNLQKKEPILVFPGDPNPRLSGLWALAFSPDNQWLASPRGNGDIHLIHLPSGEVDRVLEGQDQRLIDITFHQEKPWLIGLSGKAVHIWDIETKKLIREFPIQQELASKFDLQGDLMAMAHRGGMVSVWDLNTSRLLRTIQGHAQVAWDVALNQDGTRLASVGQDGTVKLWDIANGRQAISFEVDTSRVPSVAFSPNGETLSAGGMRGRIWVWPSQP